MYVPMHVLIPFYNICVYNIEKVYNIMRIKPIEFHSHNKDHLLIETMHVYVPCMDSLDFSYTQATPYMRDHHDSSPRLGEERIQRLVHLFCMNE